MSGKREGEDSSWERRTRSKKTGDQKFNTYIFWGRDLTVNLITVEKVKIMIKQSHKGNTSLLPGAELGALDSLVKGTQFIFCFFFFRTCVALGALNGDVLNTSCLKLKGCGVPGQMFVIYRGNSILPLQSLSTLRTRCIGLSLPPASHLTSLPARFLRRDANTFEQM